MIRICVLLCSLVLPAVAVAQTPVDWHMHLSVLDPGDEVDVRRIDGPRLRGRVASVDAEGITLEHRGRQTRVPASAVSRVDRTDRVRNGALIGFATGFGAGALMMATCEPGLFCDHSARGIVGCGMLAGSFGSGVGILIDAIVHGDHTVFRRSDASRVRVAPTVGRGHKGFLVRVGF